MEELILASNRVIQMQPSHHAAELPAIFAFRMDYASLLIPILLHVGPVPTELGTIVRVVNTV
jgi:hypothetical protein